MLMDPDETIHNMKRAVIERPQFFVTWLNSLTKLFVEEFEIPEDEAEEASKNFLTNTFGFEIDD